MRSAAPRVLVTRAGHQASELAERLRALGAEPVLVPAIETVDPTSFAALDDALARLDSFHWLLFTSANAVEAFGKRLSLRRAPESSAKVGAIGPATASALEKLGFRPDLVPPHAIAESFAEALLPHLLQLGRSRTRVLLIRAEQAREHLPDALRAAGAEVTIAPAYRTVMPQGSVDMIRSLFGDRTAQGESAAVDAISFTSSSTARNLIALCEAANVTLPPSALRISIGPITSQTLRELGFAAHAEAPEATAVSLAQAVLNALKS